MSVMSRLDLELESRVAGKPSRFRMGGLGFAYEDGSHGVEVFALDMFGLG